GFGFKTDKTLQSMLVASDPRFSIAKYVGKHGWVDMRLGPKPDWKEIEHFIVDSYRMIAPKKLVKELDARGGGGAAAAKPAVKAVKAAKANANATAKPTKAKAAAKPTKAKATAKSTKAKAAAKPKA